MDMTAHTRPDVVFICGDPGGTNAVLPVIRQIISEKKVNVRVFAYRQAVGIFTRTDIPFITLNEMTTTDSDIIDQLQKIRPDIIITGTSFNPPGLENRFIDNAKKMKIPSLSILDFWSNYSLRFSRESGNLKNVPDKIAIMDLTAYGDMVAEGFNPENLVITGQPALDSLVVDKVQFSREQRQRIRKDLGIASDALLVVFASQPHSMIYGEDESNPRFLGYTEKTVISALIKSLSRLSRVCRLNIVLLIRPHPRENPDTYKKTTNRFLRIIVSSDGNARDIVMASDLVTGMNSELLVEACYLGCVVVSLQPGLRSKDLLPTNLQGLSIPVYSQENMTDTLKLYLVDPDIRLKMREKLERIKQDGLATNRVISTIYQMISIQVGNKGDNNEKIGN